MSEAKSADRPGRILLTGATGYVGGRLLGRLEEQGWQVRCLVRQPAFLSERTGPMTEVVQADLLDPETLKPAFEGVDTAYYLVHSLGAGDRFEALEQQAAENFARAAAQAGVRRVIYLGGLSAKRRNLSAHMRSRHAVGDLLRQHSGAQVIEFRASIILGSGSISYEMIRALVERLPVMITPVWVRMRAQPIAIQDVLSYLVQGATIELDGSHCFEIGGGESCSYGELMREYARQHGLRRWMLSVPFLTPRLSSLWLGLVTPLYSRVGRRLIDSIQTHSVVREHSALDVFPVRPLDYRRALELAQRSEDEELLRTHWSGALSSAIVKRDWAGIHFGNRIVDEREITVAVEPHHAFVPVRRIGGDQGWYACQWLWHLRGWMDLLLGGVGLRRGRRDPEWLSVGEPLDWWRVVAFDPPERLLLEAEMKLPGRAWLEFNVEPLGQGRTRIRQTATFDPVGLGGLCYWYALYPLHAVIFGRMLKAMARMAEKDSRKTGRERRQGND